MAKFENSHFQDDMEGIRKALNLKRTARNEQRDNTEHQQQTASTEGRHPTVSTINSINHQQKDTVQNMSLQSESLQNQIHKRQQALAFVAEIPEPNQKERDRAIQFLQEQKGDIESIIRSLGY